MPRKHPRSSSQGLVDTVAAFSDADQAPKQARDRRDQVVHKKVAKNHLYTPEEIESILETFVRLGKCYRAAERATGVSVSRIWHWWNDGEVITEDQREELEARVRTEWLARMGDSRKKALDRIDQTIEAAEIRDAVGAFKILEEKLVLAQGRPTSRLEHTGADGKPLGQLDLSVYTDEELEILERLIGRQPSTESNRDPSGEGSEATP